MLIYDSVIENSKAYSVVAIDGKISRISHAYLFASADENYLYAFAEKVACLLLSLNDELGKGKNDLRIKKHIHPDVKFFGLNEKIDVALISSIVEDAYVSPFEEDKKIFVLFGVQNMNEASQNKLLKTIEEPPKNTYFILCATGTSKLLPTVLSRVKMVELDVISNEEIAKMLEANGVKSDRAEIYASCSNGNASFAEKLALDSGFVDFFDSVVSCFFEIKGSRDVLKYSSMFTAKNVDKDELIDISTLICRDIMMIISGKEELVVCKNVLTKLKVIASSLTLSAAAELMQLLTRAKEDLNYNSNQTAVVDSFLFKLAEVKVKCRRL